jgi:P27 family predicted phage terminase small subunit
MTDSASSEVDPLRDLTVDILAEAQKRNINNILCKIASGTPLSSTETKTIEALQKRVKERDALPVAPVLIKVVEDQNHADSIPDQGNHPAPAHLDAYGREIWYDYCNQTTDFRTLEIYASSYSRWLGAKADIKVNGLSLLITNERGQNTAKANPACAVESAAARIMMACSNKLGLKSEQTKTDAFSEFD